MITMPTIKKPSEDINQINGSSFEKQNSGINVEDVGNALENGKQNQNASNPENDYYNALKNESYKAYLDSSIQASVARDNAMKYANAGLAAQGYGSQGIAESTKLGLQNQYNQALVQGRNQYQQNMNDIAKQQYQEQKSQQQSDFESMATLMSQASSVEDLDSVLNAYNVVKNKDGTLDFSNSGLDESSIRQMNVMYSMFSNQLSDEDTYGRDASSLQAIQDITYYYRDGKGNLSQSTLGKKFKTESSRLFDLMQDGKVKNGTAIALRNGEGHAVFFKYNKGKFITLEEDEYNKEPSENRIQISTKWQG